MSLLSAMVDAISFTDVIAAVVSVAVALLSLTVVAVGVRIVLDLIRGKEKRAIGGSGRQLHRRLYVDEWSDKKAQARAKRLYQHHRKFGDL